MPPPTIPTPRPPAGCRPSNSIGSTERVVEGLRHLVHRTKADELMVTGATYDVEDRIRSLQLISANWT